MPPEEPTPTETESTYNFVELIPDQYQTIADISQRADLLANRLEILILLIIVAIMLQIFQLMRSSK